MKLRVTERRHCGCHGYPLWWHSFWQWQHSVSPTFQFVYYEFYFKNGNCLWAADAENICEIKATTEHILRTTMTLKLSRHQPRWTTVWPPWLTCLLFGTYSIYPPAAVAPDTCDDLPGPYCVTPSLSNCYLCKCLAVHMMMMLIIKY